MAAYSNTGALSRRKWSDKTVFECRERDFFHKHKLVAPAKGMPGGDADENVGSPVVQYEDFTKNLKAANLRIPWINKLTGTGKTGTNTLEASEEAPTFGYLDVIIDQLRHAAVFDAVMSAIRNPAVRTSTLKKLLVDWMVNETERSKFDALYISASKHCITESHYSATAHPNRYYHTLGSSSNYGCDNLEAAHAMDSSVLDYICEIAYDSDAPIALANDGDEEGLVVLVHTKQLTSLKQDSQFRAVAEQYQRVAPGKEGKHPYFQRASYKYDILRIYPTSRVLSASALNTRADSTVEANGTSSQYGAIVMGAQALGCGYGGFPSGWIEGAKGSGMGHDSDGNIQFQLAPSDVRDYMEKDKWAIAALFCDRRADFTMESDSSTKNRSSFIEWTQE